ncbi:hypothetical protein HK405_011417 [Cladochytrium tenue]|nr:hypothetical protein HK405_011417 [Cladochytrium tenue]
MAKHHKSALSELRSQHKGQLSIKIKEQRRKISEASKEHQEELDLLKQEQAQVMEDLVSSQGAAFDKEVLDAASAVSSIAGVLPGHAAADVRAGRTPQAAKLSGVTVFAVDVGNAAAVEVAGGARGALAAVRAVEERVAQAVERACGGGSCGGMFKVETGAGTLLYAAGLDGSHGVDGAGEEVAEGITAPRGPGEETPAESAQRVLDVVQRIVELEFDDVEGLENVEVQLRVGVASGTAVGGILGGSHSRYVLVGEAVAESVRLCREAAPGTVNVSQKTQELASEATY